MKKWIMTATCTLLMAACEGGSTGGGPMLEPKPGGLSATPRWLTYDCVEPGCETMLTANITVDGNRDVAIKRIVLSDRDRTDFEVTFSREPPFILDYLDGFSIDVLYRPTGDPRLGDVDLRVTYTDASSSESDDDRIEAGELRVPLVRRLIGEPALGVSPTDLNFGPLLQGETRTLPLTVENAGFGNTGLVLDAVVAEPPEDVRIDALPPNALIPGETFDIQVTYAPSGESYLDGRIVIQPAGENIFPTYVPVLGTSIPHPALVTDPLSLLNFGEIAVGSTVARTLEIKNRGTEPLFIANVAFTSAVPGATHRVTLAGDVATATVSPLESIEGEVVFSAFQPGEIDTMIRIASNDPVNPTVDVVVTGVLTKPIISISPPELMFGAVPRGWTVVQPIEITNSGYGELEIRNLGLILGSSELFTIRDVPILPVRLRHDQRIGLEIEFRSEAEATFNGTLSVDSSDPEDPFIEVPVVAEGASCDLGCPIANGTPSCTGGICDIGSCNENWYDADLDPASGCECREVSPTDPGEFCAEGIYMGNLDDGGESASFTGVVPFEDDVDVIRFFAEDKSQLFSDDFDVRVTLQSSDPDIMMCVYRHDSNNHENECFWENERCPENRSYRRDGSLGRGDDADFNIKVFRRPGTAPTCATYTVFMRNG